MQQLVSILIPAWNAERWIGPCIESAVGQTWPRKEIIVVDDGSRDRTFDAARKYVSAEVKVTAQENRGASAARNHALSIAQGDYIQWLDADDLLRPDKIERQMQGAEDGTTSRVLLSGSWGRFFQYPERARFRPDPLWENLEPCEWLFRKMDGNLWMAIETWLVSRRLTDHAGPWNEELLRDNDGDYFNRVVSGAREIRFVPESCSLVRRGGLGISSELTLNDRKIESLYTSLLSHVRLLRSMEDSARTRRASVAFLQRWSLYFYPRRMDLFDTLVSAAEELGGHIEPPTLRKKYRWIEALLGRESARKAQRFFPTIRTRLDRNLERLAHLQILAVNRIRKRKAVEKGV